MRRRRGRRIKWRRKRRQNNEEGGDLRDHRRLQIAPVESFPIESLKEFMGSKFLEILESLKGIGVKELPYEVFGRISYETVTE